MKKTVSSSSHMIFCKYWLPSNFNNGFPENLNERISSPLNKKSVATGCKKGFLWNIFPRVGKTTSNGRDIWDIGTK